MDASEILRAETGQLFEAPYLSNSEVRRLQRTKLATLLRHAVTNVPLYRDLYRERGVSIEGIIDGEDLWRLPSVLKRDYLNAGARRYVDERRDLVGLKSRSTSGSLGHSLAIYSTPEEARLAYVRLWSAWLAMGITHQDRLFMMAAPYLARPKPGFRSEFVAVQMSTDETIERFRALRPTAIIGAVEAIALLAAEVRRRELPERRGVRRIFPFGQTLSPQLRAMILSGFEAEIFNLYGSAEFNWIGSECEKHDGLHINADRAVVHIARFGRPDEPAAPGEVGEVIATSLVRHTTPFIRYRLEDAAAFDPTPCSCGRTAPRLKSLEGRVQDFLISTSGQWIGPATVAIDLTAGQDAIIDHRVVQESRKRARVSIVPGPGFGPSDAERIERVIRHHLGEVSVAVDAVEEIPREPSGKRRRIFRAFDLEADGWSHSAGV